MPKLIGVKKSNLFMLTLVLDDVRVAVVTLEYLGVCSNQLSEKC